MRYALIIPTINQVKLVKSCIESFNRHNPSCFKIVVDDGSPKGIQEGLANLQTESIVVIAKEKNEGFGASVNEGLKFAFDELNVDVAILVNNDIHFTQDILTPLEAALKSDPKIGIVGGLLFYPNGQVQHGGIWRIGLEGNCFGHFGHHKWAHEDPVVKQDKYCIAVTGALMGITRECYQKIGGFSPKIKLAFEDGEYCIRAWQAGFHVFYSANIQAIHAEGMTRGTDHVTKLSDPKREKWTLMEMESGGEFYKFRKSVDFNPISQKMAELNGTSDHVCFNRFQALGDVVLVTGPLREYKEAHPDHKIYVRTQHPEVFQNNPHIEKILGIEEVFVGRVIELDMAYENETSLSILQAYADKAGVDPEKCSPELFLKYDTRETLYSKFPELEKEPYVVFHQGGGWRSKSFDGLFWLKLAHEVKKTGRRIVLVGKKERDIGGMGMSGVTDLVGLLNLHELAWLCKGADLFIGPDSAPLHVSESTGTPSIGLYTCTDPFMTHYKPENYVITESTCRGCKHRQAPGLTWLECPENRDYQCVRDLSVDSVMAKVKELL